MNDSVEQSYRFALQALELAKNSNSLTEQAKALTSIAKAYKIKNDNEKALKNYLLALEIRKQLGEPKYIAQSYTNIGLTYANLGQFDKALKITWNHTK